MLHDVIDMVERGREVADTVDYLKFIQQDIRDTNLRVTALMLRP